MGLPLERSKFIKWIEHKKIINKKGKLLSICKPIYYGQVFAIGGGIENSLSLLELFAMLEKKLDIKMNYTQLDWRESDQKVFVADIEKAKRIIGWTPKVSADDGISRMIAWLIR